MKAHEGRHVVLSTRQNIRDRLRVPLPTACRGYPSGVECLCNYLTYVRPPSEPRE